MWRSTAGVLGNVLACDEKPLQAAGNQEEKISPVMTCFQLAPREIPEKRTLHHSYWTVHGILMTIPALRFICQVSSSEEELDNVQIQKVRYSHQYQHIIHYQRQWMLWR